MKLTTTLLTIALCFASAGCGDSEEDLKKMSKAAYDKGARAYVAGEYEAAAGFMSESISIRPGETNHGMRGNAYFMLGQYDKALADVDKAIAINPNSRIIYSHYYDRGRIHDAMGNTEKALADYSASIEADEKFDLPYVRRGDILAKQKKYDEALADYKKAIEHYNFYARVTARSFGTPECPFRQRSLVWKILGRTDAYESDTKRADDLARQVKEEKTKRTGKVYAN